MASNTPLLQARKIIPRLHPYRRTLQFDEPQEAGDIARENSVPDTLARKKAEWEADRSVGKALDLVASAVSFGRKAVAIDAAKFLKDRNKCGTRLSKDLVDFVVNGSGSARLDRFALMPSKEFRAAEIGPHSPAATMIREIRCQLASESDDPIGWAILAYAHTLAHNRKQALKCVDIARNLAPHDRYVLRLSSRLYLHFGDGDIAHRIISRAPRVKQDPRLLSTEIALGAICRGRSRFAAHAAKMLKNAQPAQRFSELAATLGTIEIENGNSKKGRKLLSFAMKAPTENTIAQAIHLNNRGEISLAHDLQSPPDAFEAKALGAYYGGQWQDALHWSRQWQEDEPCSVRPAVLGTFVAITILHDYSSAIEIAKLGLQANPRAFPLINNLGVAYACSDNADDAKMEIAKVREAELDHRKKVTLEATRGLIAFRQGKADAGRRHYSLADTLAEKESDEAIAYVRFFHAMEEARIEGNGEFAEPARRKAEQSAKRIPAQSVAASIRAQLDAAKPAS